MKILHALASCLAVTALHFRRFAFASSLAAIDYDGYVNITQHHWHSDSGALMKRVPGDIIEARQAAIFLVVPAVVFIIVGEAALTVVYIREDDPVRGSDVEFLEEHFDY